MLRDVEWHFGISLRKSGANLILIKPESVDYCVNCRPTATSEAIDHSISSETLIVHFCNMKNDGLKVMLACSMAAKLSCLLFT